MVQSREQRRDRLTSVAPGRDLLSETSRLARVGGWRYELETQTLEMTEMMRALYEVDAGVVPDLDAALALCSPEAAASIAAALRRLVETGESFELELPLFTAKKHQLFVRAMGEGIFENGRLVALQGIVEDIGQRKARELELEARCAQLERQSAQLETQSAQLETQSAQRDVRPTAVDGVAPRAFPACPLTSPDRVAPTMPEVALAASEEAWRVAFDAIDDILCVISPTHELLEMNRAGCVSLGLPRDQVIGRKCYELIHGSDRPIAGCPCCRAVRSEGPEEAEYEQDGRTYNLAAWPILDAEQRVTALVHTVRDVTEQRRIKEEIEGLARFPEENRSPVLRIGADGTLRYANPAAQTSLTCWQLSLGQPVPQEWISLVDAALRDGERRQFELECGEQSYSFEICPVRASGYVNAYGHDVTERMRMERDIRDSWRLVSSVVENVPLMVFVKDAQDLRFVMVNKATEELLGFSRRELLGRSDRDFFPPEQAAFFICKDREVLASGAPVDVPEELVRTPHRGDRWLHTRKVCIKGADGSPKYLLGISEDITERKRDEAVRQELEGRLQAAQKLEAIGSLAGGVAHDFNNLLSVILSYNSLAMEALADGDPIREDLVEVRNAGESAASLTRQLLAFSRKQVLEPVTLDVNAVVASVEKMLRRVISAHIALVPVLSPDLGWIKADPCQIEQVLVNLVVNARDAMPDGGTITIETSNLVIDRHQSAATVGLSPGDYVRIAVGDTGSGMDEPTLARIFEPFFTTKSQGRGTGLGLSTVYGIIKQSGGEIWVSSELGRGTTFTLCFPRELSPPTAVRGESDEPSARRDAGTETVLVVEDEPALLGVARRALAEMGYKVLSAADAEQALSIADRHDGEIHLLVSDIMMPGMRGDHLAQRLLTTRPTLRVLYMTAYAQDGVAHHRVDLDPPAQLLHKPFTTAELTQRVRAVLDRDERGLGLGPSSAPQDATQI